MDIKKNVPEIRFEEFKESDAWEECELGDVADKFDNLRVPITARDRVSGSIPYYGANGIQDYVEDFTHDGEFVLLAEDGANDLADYPVQYVNGKVWVNNHAHVLSGKEDILDNRFLMNSLKQINIEPYLVGGGRAKLNADVMMRLTLKITSIDEQVKIGEFFTNLDQTIAFQQRKLEKTQMVKKSLLEKMFPKNGESFPEIRFDGFTDAWEQRELGEVLVVNSGRDYKHLAAGDIPVYGTGGYMLSVNDKLSDEDAVGIGRKGSIDNPQYLKAPFWTVDTLFFLTPKEDLSLRFFFVMSQGIKWRQFDESTGVPSLSKVNIEKIAKSFPKLNEQEKIGNFFQNLDQTIAFQQRELEKLKNMKKALLEKMFV